MTGLSRISGLVRDIAFAQILGSGLFADAFFVAFRIPNFFRRVFAEGAVSEKLAVAREMHLKASLAGYC